MPVVESKGSNVIRIEPNPLKRSSVKIKIQNISVSGGSPKYKTDEHGKKLYQMSLKEPKNLSRMPGTIVEYSAAIEKGGLRTGLDEYVDNPFVGLDFYRVGWEQILKGKQRIRLQELLEYKHNKPMGFYTNQLFGEIKSSYASSNDLPFYMRSESRVSLRDGVTYLDLNNPIHEANYHMLKAHKMIANSYEELKYNPNATHYIVDLKEKQRVGSDETRKMNKFAARLEELYDLNDNTIINMCKALDLSSKGIKNDKQSAYEDIDAMVRQSNDKYEDFMNLYEMWKNPVSRDTFLGYAELFDYLRVPGLVSMKGNQLFWQQPIEGGKKQLWEWRSKEDFVKNFLIAPQYQEEVDVLRQEFRAKTRYEMS